MSSRAKSRDLKKIPPCASLSRNDKGEERGGFSASLLLKIPQNLIYRGFFDSFIQIKLA